VQVAAVASPAPIAAPELEAAVDAPDAAPLHTASLQAAARPQAVLTPDAPRAPDPSLPAADLANGFALPADQLMPVTLIGLQVNPGDAWPMSRQADTPEVARRDARDDEEARRPRRPTAEAADDAGGREPRSADTADGDRIAADEPLVVLDDPDAAEWQGALSRMLNERLAAPQPPAALRNAAEQWSRARCIVLVCPKDDDAAEAAWAFVLWPRRMARPRGPMAARFQFTGQRFEARLQWSTAGPAWCETRAVKEHHARAGRRLVALDAAGTPLGAVPCELQLGPVRFAPPRWKLAGVRIDAVRRFWTALGGQWSVLLVIGPQPLLAVRAPATVVEAA
jgi:hypothetical protein